jgi:hypothetical protein
VLKDAHGGAPEERGERPWPASRAGDHGDGVEARCAVDDRVPCRPVKADGARLRRQPGSIGARGAFGGQALGTVPLLRVQSAGTRKRNALRRRYGRRRRCDLERTPGAHHDGMAGPQQLGGALDR